jgi:hypothetical protein
MSKINYAPSSPYASTAQTSWHIGRYKHRRIVAHRDDRIYVVKTGEEYRPDKLALALYGSEAYWWVFMVRNIKVIRDPIWDFKAGLSIMVPSAAHLKSALGAK